MGVKNSLSILANVNTMSKFGELQCGNSLVDGVIFSNENSE